MAVGKKIDSARCLRAIQVDQELLNYPDARIQLEMGTEAMRKGVAHHYLQNKNIGISDTAYLRGYSEPSAFYRDS